MKKHPLILCAGITSLLLSACNPVKVPEAILPVPEAKQVEWQKMETYAFVHFGLNTFNDREWGYGDSDPKTFNPAKLDCEQWVKTFVESGMKGVILTAKHHDGFCLWPTQLTEYCIRNTPYKNGQGDIVRELSDACKKYGIKFAVYLSPWDRHQANYGTPEYVDYFYKQLHELLTNYGDVFEIWFDGANGGDGWYGGAKDSRTIDRKTYYNYPRAYKMIDELQPQAVIFSDGGPGCRWVGNEKGVGRETEWNATVLTPGIYARSQENNKRLGVFSKAEDLGSRKILEKATELFWYPSEVDVSIRPGWFYHAEEDGKVKSLKHLSDIYFQSVGYNSVLLLNIPPDRRGLIHEADIKRLKEFADYRQQTFADNRVKNGRKYWSTTSGGEAVYALKSKSEINLVMLQEDITKGQRVEAFTVEALTDNGWKEVGKGTTIGYKRMLRFPAVNANKLRVRIDECRLTAYVSQVAAYYAEPLQEETTKEDWNNLPRSGWKQVAASPLTIDLGKTVTLSSFTYAPSKAEAKPTMAFRYQFFVSMDGKSWKEVPASGEFSNIMHNPLPQTVAFSQKVQARFIKLEATTPDATVAKVNMNELGVMVIP